MKKINRILTCIPLILMVLTGCVIGARVESPVVFEPVPVTPIAPPEGIRGTMSVDPRVYIERQQGESEFLMPQENQTGLGLCFPQGEGVQEVEAYANEVDNFRADVYIGPFQPQVRCCTLLANTFASDCPPTPGRAMRYSC